MWNGRFFKRKPEPESKTLLVAVEHGFMTMAIALALDAEVIALSSSVPTTEWLVSNGHLTHDQASIVEDCRKRNYPDDHLEESMRAARSAVQKDVTGLNHLEDVLNALKAKKEVA